MKVLHQLSALAAIAPKPFMAIGVFDGVHRGHQQVIQTVIDHAREEHGQSVVLTFDPHPLRVLRGDQAPRILTATTHKLRLLEDLGVDACLVLPFDQQLAQTSASDFIQCLSRSLPHLQEICVGDRFRFGHGREGDVALITKLAAAHNYRATAVAAVSINGHGVSSTAIREAVRSGDLALARQLLGRPFSLLGTVQHGDGIGSGLGFPTANLDIHGEVMPPNGVFSVIALLETSRLDGVVNIGTRPTIQQTDPTRRVEVHLLDFTGDLYGNDLEIAFIGNIRNEVRFADRTALTAQIEQDVAVARQHLRAHRTGSS